MENYATNMPARHAIGSIQSDDRSDFEKRLAATDEITNRIRSASHRLAEVLQRLSGGPMEGAAEEEPKTAVPSGLFNRLDEAQADSMAHISAIETAIDRLQKLI